MLRLCWKTATAGLLAGLAASAAAPAVAQSQVEGVPGRHHPLNQTAPVGEVARWTGHQGRWRPGEFQPVRFELPGGGNVSIYSGPARQPVPVVTPGQAALAVGQVYRLRLDEMPQFPGVELFPSVELIDRLSPPPGQAVHFPIPVDFTEDEIELALAGHLITKVVYLEQPGLAVPAELPQPLEARTIPPHQNVLAEADRLGRPMAVVRLGGRVPDPRVPDPQFFGSGAPVMLPRP